jgi:hypothetical protein
MDFYNNKQGTSQNKVQAQLLKLTNDGDYLNIALKKWTNTKFIKV